MKALAVHEALPVKLMEKICEPSNLNGAYKRVKAKKGAPGVDGMTVNMMRDYIATHKSELLQSLLNGSYRPQPVKEVLLPKPDGGVRQLGIPTVMDRLVQQAILQILQPIFEPKFSNSSFGFRPGRSAHQAVKRAQEIVKTGRRIVVDIDLEKFFDRVNHDKLMSKLAKYIADKRLLKIIRAFLQAGIMRQGVCINREEGTPQGGNLSPLLSNIVLDELDQELERRGHQFCRYADDCNIYVKSWEAGRRVMKTVKQFLLKRLHLKINEEKSAVAKVMERQFLGFRFLNGGKIGLAKRSEKRIKDSIRKITKRNRGVSFERIIDELNVKLRGWINYFKLCETPSKFQELDKWKRHKLRCYRMKQRKRGYSVATFLMSLGVSEYNARHIGSSGKGHWRLSNTRPVKQAMSIEWFNKMKLINLEQQMKQVIL